MARIIITGADGFIGTHLVNHLKEEHGITALTKDICDIKEIDKMDFTGADVVIHLASTVDNYNVLDNPTLDVEVNCIGTIKLLETMRRDCPNAKLVYFSTFFVNRGNPLGLYGASKLCAEHICKTYSRVFDINVSIVRPTNIYGPLEQRYNNKKAAFNRMIGLACKDKEISVYKDNPKRDYLYVTDLCSAVEIIMKKGKNQEVYEVGTGESISFVKMVEMITKLAGGKIVMVDSPEFHKQVGLQDWFNDISKIKELGWLPKVKLEEGIKNTIEDYKNEN